MTLKEKVSKALPFCGTHVNMAEPMVMEILGSLGYDFIWVDMEHTYISPEQIYHHLLAAKGVGAQVVVRVPVNDLTVTKRVLEMGVDGVVFPMVRDAAHAKELLDWTLYPPYGKRGCGPKRAIRYGLDDERGYYAKGHLEMCRFVQIELKSAAEEAEEIAALPYLDGCVLGMFDLSGSIGKPGDIFCEENLALANRAIRAFRDAGKTVGVSTFSTDRETLKRYVDMGVNMITTGADYLYMMEGGKKTLETVSGIFGK